MIFLVFKIAICSPYWLQIKFSMSLFPYLFTFFAINLWHRKFVTADVAAVFVNNQHHIQQRGQDFDKNTYIHSAYTVTCVEKLKLVHLKCNLFTFSSIYADYLQKFEFLISRGSVATCLRWGGYCHIGFVTNFIRFPAMQKIWKLVNIWQSYRELKGGNFFETQCICTKLTNFITSSVQQSTWHRLLTRSSATAEQPLDALRQLKYGRFWLTYWKQNHDVVGHSVRVSAMLFELGVRARGLFVGVWHAGGIDSRRFRTPSLRFSV